MEEDAEWLQSIMEMELLSSTSIPDTATSKSTDNHGSQYIIDRSEIARPKPSLEQVISETQIPRTSKNPISNDYSTLATEEKSEIPPFTSDPDINVEINGYVKEAVNALKSATIGTKQDQKEQQCEEPLKMTERDRLAEGRAREMNREIKSNPKFPDNTDEVQHSSLPTFADKTQVASNSSEREKVKSDDISRLEKVPEEDIFNDGIDFFMKSVQLRLMELGYGEKETASLTVEEIDFILRNNVPSKRRVNSANENLEIELDKVKKAQATDDTPRYEKDQAVANTRPIPQQTLKREGPPGSKNDILRAPPEGVRKKRRDDTDQIGIHVESFCEDLEREIAPSRSTRRSRSVESSGRDKADESPVRSQRPGARVRSATTSRTGKTSQRRSEDEELVGNDWWPGLEPFRNSLREETKFRAQLLGPGFNDMLKQEGRWRYNLYKDWLKLLKTGVGDPSDVVPLAGYEGKIDGRERPIMPRFERSAKVKSSKAAKSPGDSRPRNLDAPEEREYSESVEDRRRKERARIRYEEEMLRRRAERARASQRQRDFPE